MLETPKSFGKAKSYHVSRLKKFVQDADPNRGQVLRPDPDVIEDVEEYEVEAIMNHRYKRIHGRQLLEYLVKWVGYDQAECTWESEENVKNSPRIVARYRKDAGLPPI
jgi:hypothetical protein